LVTIVTPSFNQAEFLEETILSVLRQDYPNIEYIIIDGGSSDNSVEIIKKYENRLAYWISESDNGQTDAIIKGFSKAKGQYITWLCSDDILEPSTISLSVAFLQRYSEAVLTFGNRVRIDSKGNITAVSRKGSFYKWCLKLGLTLPQETVLIRRSDYDKSDGLDASLNMAMDFDLWCKLLKLGPFIHIPAYLGRFRTHSANKSHIYSKQLKETGYNSGNPSEVLLTMRKHFGISPSKYKLKLGLKMYQASSFAERRRKSYREKLNLVNQIKKYGYPVHSSSFPIPSKKRDG